MYLSTQLTEDRKNVIVWERGPDGKRVAVYYDAPYEFFVENEDSDQECYSVTGKKLEKIEFTSHYDFYGGRKRLREAEIKIYESDISPELKVLSDNYYNSPLDGDLHVTFYDIEVDYDPERGHSRPDNPYARISSIALYHKHTDESIVLALRPKTGEWSKVQLDELPRDLFDHSKIELLSNEKELLTRFYQEIEDSDVVSGWNSDWFDDPYIYSRTMKVLGKKYTRLMNFPESDLDVRVDEREKFGTMEMVVKPHGRIWIDFMEMVKKFDASERDSYSLESVAEESLDGFQKLSYDKSLYRLYHEDFDEFLRYNIRDTDILKHLDLKFKYMDLALNFSHMTTNNIPAVLGTTSTSDTAILNFCKHEQDKRLVLPDAPYDVFDDGTKFEGAFVLDPQIGLHEWIASVDIKSLYPSSMRAINISPETIIGQFFENEKAFEYIQEKSGDIHLTLLYEDGNDETMTASEWRNALEKRNWAISGHGTIFDQAKDGVIPCILTKWFDERIEYQKKKVDAYAKHQETNEERYKKEAEYYDNIQYLKKIQLNSLYGVFGNKYFRFFDVRLAESTTKTGKNILLHMAKKIALILDGEYKYPSKSILYGDTDSVVESSVIEINGEFKNVGEWFKEHSTKYGTYMEGKKEIIKMHGDNNYSPCYNPETKRIIDKEILTIYRHKISKPLFRIELECGKIVTVTEDHSLVVERDGQFIEIAPDDLKNDDVFITINRDTDKRRL